MYVPIFRFGVLAMAEIAFWNSDVISALDGLLLTRRSNLCASNPFIQRIINELVESAVKPCDSKLLN